MSVQAMGWVIDHSRHKGNAFVVLLMIANHASHEGDSCWPSIPTLAHEARVTERQVFRVLLVLESSGELRIERHKGRGNHNNYFLPAYQQWVTKCQVFTNTENLTSETENMTFETLKPDITGSAIRKIRPKPAYNRPKVFDAPTLENLSDYCLERQNSIDPQHFLDYYMANGWRVGRNAMKDWRAAVRTWEKNSHGGNANGSKRDQEFAAAIKRGLETD